MKCGKPVAVHNCVAGAVGVRACLWTRTGRTSWALQTVRSISLAYTNLPLQFSSQRFMVCFGPSTAALTSASVLIFVLWPSTLLILESLVGRESTTTSSVPVEVAGCPPCDVEAAVVAGLSVSFLVLGASAFLIFAFGILCGWL